MPLDKCQSHTTHLRPDGDVADRRSASLRVELPLPTETQSSGTPSERDTQSLACQIFFSISFPPPAAARRQPYILPPRWSLRSWWRGTMSLPGFWLGWDMWCGDFANQDDHQIWNVTTVNDTKKKRWCCITPALGALETLKWEGEAAEKIIITSCKHWPSLFWGSVEEQDQVETWLLPKWKTSQALLLLFS